jgi:nucleoid DNA-binding protein
MAMTVTQHLDLLKVEAEKKYPRLFSKAQLEWILRTSEQLHTQDLRTSGRVTVRWLGNFDVRRTKPRMFRNLQTGQMEQKGESKRLHFKANKIAKTAIGQVAAEAARERLRSGRTQQQAAMQARAPAKAATATPRRGRRRQEA